MFLNVGHNNARGEAKEAVYPAHPFCVAAGQIVVHGHDMDALALNGVQVAGQCFGQGLTFPRAHFGNLAAMQNNTANHLHVKMAHAHNALRCFPHCSEGLRQDIVERFAGCQPIAEYLCLALQPVIIHGRYFVLKRVDLVNDLHDRFNVTVVRRPKNGFGKSAEHR